MACFGIWYYVDLSLWAGVLIQLYAFNALYLIWKMVEAGIYLSWSSRNEYFVFVFLVICVCLCKLVDVCKCNEDELVYEGLKY